MIGRGVPFGASTPYQFSDRTVGKPASIDVGTSGKRGQPLVSGHDHRHEQVAKDLRQHHWTIAKH